MTENIGNIILFDVAGDYLRDCSDQMNDANLKDVISKMVHDKVLEEVLSNVKVQIKSDISTELTEEMKKSFALSLSSVSSSINDLKKDIDEFKSAIRVSKNYISFTKRRLVSVSDAKDESDVVTKKQLLFELSKLHK